MVSEDGVAQEASPMQAAMVAIAGMEGNRVIAANVPPSQQSAFLGRCQFSAIHAHRSVFDPVETKHLEHPLGERLGRGSLSRVEVPVQLLADWNLVGLHEFNPSAIGVFHVRELSAGLPHVKRRGTVHGEWKAGSLQVLP